MQKHLFLRILIVAMVLSLFVSMPSEDCWASGPAILYVDSTSGDDNNDGTLGNPFATINKAITTAKTDYPGHEVIIYLKAGDYIATEYITHANLTIEAFSDGEGNYDIVNIYPDYDTTLPTPNQLWTSEWIFAVDNLVSKVGFTLSHVNLSGDNPDTAELEDGSIVTGLYIYSADGAGTYLTLDSCTISNVQNGVIENYSDSSTLSILNCDINAYSPVSLDSSPSLIIHDSTLKMTCPESWGSVIDLDGTPSVNIQRNTIMGNNGAGRGIYEDVRSGTISNNTFLDLDIALELNEIGNLTISTNYVETTNHGFDLETCYYNPATMTVNDNTIINKTLKDHWQTGIKLYLNDGTGGSTFNVYGNEIVNFPYGLYYDGDSIDDTISLNFSNEGVGNKFRGNLLNLYIEVLRSTSKLDMRYMDWGTTDSQEIFDRIYFREVYPSFDTATAAATHEEAFIFDEIFSTTAPDAVYVDDDYTSSTPGFGETYFNSISEAKSWVKSGGTINVAEGLYDEQVFIFQPVMIHGAGENTVIKNTAVDSSKPIMLIAAPDTTVRGLNFRENTYGLMIGDFDYCRTHVNNPLNFTYYDSMANNATVYQNYFGNQSYASIYIDYQNYPDTLDGLTVEANTFNSESSNSYYALHSRNDFVINSPVVKDNKVEYGYMNGFYLKFGENALLRGNDIVIDGVFAEPFGNKVGLLLFPEGNGLITDNTIHLADGIDYAPSANDSIGIRYDVDATPAELITADFYNNCISGFDYALYFYGYEVNLPEGSIDVTVGGSNEHYNDLRNNTYGVVSQYKPVSIDASYNLWGVADEDIPSMILDNNDQTYYGPVTYLPSTTIFFEEDFESYAENTYPISFTLEHVGTGEAEQKVISTTGYDSKVTKVFRLQSQYNWASEHIVALPEVFTQDLLVIDAYIKPVAGSWPGRIGLFNKSGDIRVSGVLFDSGGKITAVQNGNDSNKTELGSYTLGNWYNVTIEHDMGNKTYDVYIDGIKVGTDIPMSAAHDATHLNLTGGNINLSETYFDNVCMYTAKTDAQKVAADKAALTEELIKAANTDLSSVTTDLNLVIAIPDGAGCVINWACDNETLITTDGTVSRPAYGSGDATVTLTATITSGVESDTAEFTVTVKEQEQTDAQKVASDKTALTVDLIKGTNIDLTNVTADLSLVTAIPDGAGCTISWACDNETVIVTDGTVTRPAYGSGDAAVTLTATITSGVESDTAEFTVTVKEQEQTDAQKVASDKAALTVDLIKGTNIDLTNVTADLSLVTAIPDGAGCTISWACDNETVIVTDGTVTRPAYGSGDAAVTLTATITSGVESDTAKFTITVKELPGSSEEGGSSSGGSSYTPPAITVTTEKTDETTRTSTEIQVASFSGKAAASISSLVIDALVVKANVENGTSKDDVIEVSVNTPTDTRKLEVTIPQAGVDKISAKSDSSFGITSPLISITFDGKAIETISGAAEGGNITLSAVIIDETTLSEKDRAKVDGRPVYDLSVQNGDVQVSHFGGGHATVRIPYTLKPGENPNAVLIYYLANDGSLKGVRGHFDATAKAVVFKTPHFSKFAIGYNLVSFSDITSDAWYKKAVEFIAAREITSGTGNGQFSPEAKLTRAQFVVMLMKAYQIETQDGEYNAVDNFADAGSTYYTDYLLAAKGLGIVNGLGNNLFAPDREIIRQEMIVMLYNALKVLDEIPATTENKPARTVDELTNNFNDADKIAPWAKEAITIFVEAGIITGSNNNVNPTSSTTRSEIAQVLYNLLAQ